MGQKSNGGRPGRKSGSQIVCFSNGRRPAGIRPPADATAPVADDRPIEQANAEAVKTRLTSDELDYFARLLHGKRAELQGDLHHMRKEALGTARQEAAGDLSKIPMHMADIGTDHYEQEFTLGLLESEQRMLVEIEHALARIARGTYGICEATQKPISKARLKAQPWARYCVEYARQMEQNGRRRRVG